MWPDTGDFRLPFVERNFGFAGPLSFRGGKTTEGEEGREGDQVGVLRRQAKRGAGGFLGKQATFPAEGLRNGNQDAVTAEGKLVDDEAFGRTLRGDF